MAKLGYSGRVVLAALLFIGAAALFYFTSLPKEGEQAPRSSLKPGTAFGWPARAVALAGNGVAGFADGEARLARFADPFGLAIDRQGNLFVADAGDTNRIRKILPDGMVTTLAGTREGFADGTAEAAFNTPSGLAIDEAGNLLVADTGNNAIRKITPQGVVTTVAGDGTAGYRDGPVGQARFNGPIGVAIDKTGTIFVADSYNDRIRVISPAGEVTTLAGAGTPGFQDGAGSQAKFDTPCALLVDAKGELIVADTRNNALRLIDRAGQVSTVSPTLPPEGTASFWRPVSLAMTSDGFLYVGTMGAGRIFQISPAGEMRGLTGLDIDIERGDSRALRVVQPNGLAVGPDGTLLVADSPARRLRRIAPRAEGDLPGAEEAPVLPETSVSWPVNPKLGFHEIVGTVGEVRGNDQGDSRDHFHAGLDVQANMGTPIVAVAAEKVSQPLPTWGYESLSEGMSLDSMVYIHMRVGRTADGAPIDPSRFQMVTDDSGKPRIRVKRGTRFAVGDVLGTVNRMYHVHLEFHPDGSAHNGLELSFPGLKDRIAPHIEEIRLVDRNGNALTAKEGGRLLVPASAGDIGIVVGAYDQSDGNVARRRLGLYQLGYQILSASGESVAGFEQLLVTLEFNRLPPDQEAVKIAYAEGSGETVHGSAATRFLYAVTNVVRDGRAEAGSWHAAALPRGDYVIRIFASDHAGNIATTGRDLPVRLN